jgi:hypothetical protein
MDAVPDFPETFAMLFVFVLELLIFPLTDAMFTWTRDNFRPDSRTFRENYLGFRMDATLSVVSSLALAFAAGIVVAVRQPDARAEPNGDAPATKPNGNARYPSPATSLKKNSPNARYPSPSAPPATESAMASANSRYTKNYGGSSRRVTFATSPPDSARGRKNRRSR